MFARFLRFGFLAWGGPVAQIAMIRRELVEEQKWLDPARFNRLLAVYQVLPGPEAHELCVHLGTMRAGRWGGVVAGLGFMLPGLLLMLLLAWFYRQLDLEGPPWAALFLGIQVAVVAIIVRAVHRIGGHILANRWLWAAAAVSAAASAVGVSFWIVLPVAGLFSLFASHGRFVLAGAVLLVGALAALAAGPAGAGDAGIGPVVMAGAGEVGALPLFLSGLKGGLLTFGGAYTAIPFIRGDAAGRGWIDDATFLDGLALSQVIPAPLVIFATFVGFQAGGLAGALAMTAGMFLPAFAFTLILFERLERLVEEERLHRLLEGVAAGVVGLIAVTAVELGAGVARLAPSPATALSLLGLCLVPLYSWSSRLAVPAIIALSAIAGLLLFG